MDPQESAGFVGKKQHVALLLVGGMSVVQAATEAKVAARTAYGWMANPAYRRHVNNLRSPFIDEALGRLTAAATRSVEVMVALLDCNEPHVRLRASTSIVDTLIKLREHTEFARRLEALEARGTIEVAMIEADDDPPDLEDSGPDNRMYGDT